MPAPRRDTNDETNKAEAAGRDATKQAADAGLRAADEVAHTARVMADEAGAAAQRTAGAAADIALSSAETVQQSVQSGLDMAAQMTERTITQFTRVWGLPDRGTEETARQATCNVQTIMDCGTVIAHGLQDISREWLGQAQERLQKNLDGVNALLRARSPQDAIAVQSDLARDNLEALLQQSRRVSERIVAVADEAMGKINAQARETARQAQRAS